jgi:hypothetical protein
MQPMPICLGRAIGLFSPWEWFACTIFSAEGRSTMATSAERMRALRERERRGMRRLTVDVSEADLRTLAERGYEGAASTDHDQQAQAVALILNDTLFANLIA